MAHHRPESESIPSPGWPAPAPGGFEARPGPIAAGVPAVMPPSGVRPGDHPSPAGMEGVMIGVVHFRTHRGEPAEAILDDDGRWRCPRLPVLDRVLNILYDPRREAMAGDPFGHAALHAAAAWLKGTAVPGPLGPSARETP